MRYQIIKTCLLLSLCFSGTMLIGQEDATFSVDLSRDSMLIGNRFELTFTLENSDLVAEFNQPDLLNDFDILGGPNTSTSIQITNGVMKQKRSWSYILQPKSPGIFYIPPVTIETEAGFMETQAQEVIVYQNPDGIIQDPKSGIQLFPDTPTPPAEPKSKKKRKITRI